MNTGARSPHLRVLYPGSFDPLHLGHLDVIEQAVELFGEVVVAVLYNFAKDSGMFDVERRVALAEEATAHLASVSVEKHSGLTTQAAQEAGVDFIVKGLRTPGDFEIEQQMAQMNHSTAGVRTVYVPSSPALSFISSRFVREIAKYGGNIAHLVPPCVADALGAEFARTDQGANRVTGIENR